MTIWATGHNLRCDVSFCAREFGEMENYFVLVEQAERAGWALGRKLDGTRAKRGGKDYCPTHNPNSDGANSDGAP